MNLSNLREDDQKRFEFTIIILVRPNKLKFKNQEIRTEQIKIWYVVFYRCSCNNFIKICIRYYIYKQNLFFSSRVYFVDVQELFRIPNFYLSYTV